MGRLYRVQYGGALDMEIDSELLLSERGAKPIGAEMRYPQFHCFISATRVETVLSVAGNRFRCDTQVQG